MMRILAAVIALLAWAAPAAAQDSTLADARVGEWAKYATSRGNMEELHSVIARRQRVIVVKVDSIINGKVISSRTENFNINDPDFSRDSGSAMESVNAGGRRYNCFVVQKGRRTFYYSNEVPVTGLVLVLRDGERLQEIMEFGF